MDFIDLISLVVKTALAIWQYVRGNADQKAAAVKAMRDQMALLEQQGQPIMRDIVVQMGRTSFEDWSSIPVAPATTNIPIK